MRLVTRDLYPAWTWVEGKKAGVRGVITRLGTTIPVPVTKSYRGFNQKEAGHEETDYGSHPAAYFICFGFKVLIEPHVEQMGFFVIYFNINIVEVIWKR